MQSYNYDTPALVNPRNGITLALDYGTRYAIRIPEKFIEAALKCGCTAEQTWAGGSKTNIEKLFGNGWLFGGWCGNE